MWKRADNIREAINFGTTLTSRFWLSMAMILHGSGFFLNQSSWLASPTFATLNGIVNLNWWGIAFFIGGSAGMWRVWAPKGRPMCAWLINAYVFTLWSITTMIKIWNGGDYNWATVLSTHTAWLITAAWCLARTEATVRDKETA